MKIKMNNAVGPQVRSAKPKPSKLLPILGGVYERAFRITAIAGPGAPEGLDELGDRIAELLFTLNRERGTTLILVTHDLTLARRCDRCLTLEAGKLVEWRDDASAPAVATPQGGQHD